MPPSRPTSLSIGSVALLASMSAAAGAADWPEWRGPGRRGVWNDVKLPSRLSAEVLRERWKVPAGGGYSGISVADGKVYTMDRPSGGNSERIFCVDLANGKTIWSDEYPAPYGDLDHGNGPRATPTIAAGRLHTIGAMGHVRALDAGTGKLIWSIDTVSTLGARLPTWGHAASPLVAGGAVIFQVGAKSGGTVMAFDPATGAERWRALDDRPSYSSPILIDIPGRDGKAERQVVVWTADSVVGLGLERGEVRWRVPFVSTYDVAIANPVYEEGLLLVSGYWEGAKTVSLDGSAAPSLVWSGKSLSCLMATPLFREGRLYALDRKEGLLGIEWRTGKVLWSDGHRATPAGQNPQASLVWAGKHAVLLNELGELILAKLSEEGYEEAGRAPLIERTWAHPAFSGQLVIARSDRSLVCAEVLAP